MALYRSQVDYSEQTLEGEPSVGSETPLILPHASVLHDFKEFYQNFSQASLKGLGDIYAENVVFSDPVHTIEGIANLEQYFEDMCGNLSHCHFVFVDELITANSATFKWQMHYQHPSLKSNKPLLLTGVSLIHYSDKVDRHEDFYDMGAMLYENLPLLGSVIRLIKSRLVK